MTDKTDSIFSASLAPRFNRLNRAILTAESPEEWRPAIAEMSSFLLEVEDFVQRRADLLAQDTLTSSRVISLLLTLAATGTQGRLELYQPKDEKGMHGASWMSTFRQREMRRLAINARA